MDQKELVADLEKQLADLEKCLVEAHAEIAVRFPDYEERCEKADREIQDIWAKIVRKETDIAALVSNNPQRYVSDCQPPYSAKGDLVSEVRKLAPLLSESDGHHVVSAAYGQYVATATRALRDSYHAKIKEAVALRCGGDYGILTTRIELLKESVAATKKQLVKARTPSGFRKLERVQKRLEEAEAAKAAKDKQFAEAVKWVTENVLKGV